MIISLGAINPSVKSVSLLSRVFDVPPQPGVWYPSSAPMLPDSAFSRSPWVTSSLGLCPKCHISVLINVSLCMGLGWDLCSLGALKILFRCLPVFGVGDRKSVVSLIVNRFPVTWLFSLGASEVPFAFSQFHHVRLTADPFSFLCSFSISVCRGPDWGQLELSRLLSVPSVWRFSELAMCRSSLRICLK